MQALALTKEMSRVRTLTVLIDQGGCECLYIDGVRWDQPCETTIYVTDLAEAAKGEPVLLEHLPVNLPEDFEGWPKSLQECLVFCSNIYTG